MAESAALRVEEILAEGARRARAIARPVLDEVRRAAGLGPPPS